MLAALLYGGLESKEEIYQAFLEEELPEGKTVFQWDAQLSGGYCTVSCHHRSHPTTYDEAGLYGRFVGAAALGGPAPAYSIRQAEEMWGENFAHTRSPGGI